MTENEETPKVELHRHLELSLRPETIWELAPLAGIQITSQQDFQKRFLILEPMADLGSVLQKFLDTQKLLSSPEILERIAYEAVCDAYTKENVHILELRYAPTFVQMNHKMSFEQIHEAIVAGVTRAELEYPIAVGIICIVQRILPAKDAERVVDFAIANKDSFVGMDLADNEEGFDSKPFAPAFKRAAAAGLGITIHSGEAPNANAPKWVLDAIEVLGAKRIGHGVQIYRDPEVMKKVRDMGVVLELCPTSNVLTQAVTQVKTHPLKKLFEFGVKTTINTDDPGIFNTNMNREFRICRDILGFKQAELETCMQYGAEASFIPRAKRAKVWKSLA